MKGSSTKKNLNTGDLVDTFSGAGGREVVDERIQRILAVAGHDAEEGSAEACRTVAEAAEELSAYLWMLRALRRRTA